MTDELVAPGDYVVTVTVFDVLGQSVSIDVPFTLTGNLLINILKLCVKKDKQALKFIYVLYSFNSALVYSCSTCIVHINSGVLMNCSCI